MKVIETIGLTKIYKNSRKGIDNLNLSVENGEIFSLLGTNGVGKTTLINILTTFLKPTAGKAFVVGKDVEKEADFVRSQVSCVAQNVSADNHLTLHENMIFQGRLYGMGKGQLQKNEQNLFELFKLQEYASEKAGSCSGGIKRRLDISMSMLSKPKILFLDEPTVGMDIQSRQIMWATLKRLKEELGTTIFLTTHYLEEAAHLSDTICFMANGKKIVQDSLINLRRFIQKDIIRIATTSQDDSAAIEGYLKGNKYIRHSYCKGEVLYLQVSEKRQAMQEIGTIVLKYPACVGMEIVEPTLEDIFLEITEKGGI